MTSAPNQVETKERNQVMNSVNIRIAAITASGRRAQALITETNLGERLPQGLLETLGKDIAALSVPETANADTVAFGLTGKQMEACQRAYRRLSAIRRAVVRQTKNREVRRFYGVGERLAKHVVRDIVHGLEVVIGRMESHPDEAKSFGFAPDTVELLKAHRVEVTGADDAQERARADRPGSTRARNQAAKRVALAVGVISDLGAMTFVDDDAKRTAFEGLVSHAGSVQTPSPAPAETPCPTPPAEGAPASS